MGNAAYGYKWRKLCAQAKAYYSPRCHLCNGDIDLTLDRKHQQSWTLDHLHPVAIHGDTVPDLSAVRPAHRYCNERRGAAPLAQVISPRSENW